jgi:hypothetical protein
MKKFIARILVLSVCGLFFAACSSAPPPSTGGASGGSSRSSRPEWVAKPGTVYPEAQYVVATGEGKTAEEAQYKARANLLNIFGMKLADESVIAEVYQETNIGGNVSWSDSVKSERKISASAEGILAGCEIKETWKNASGTENHALAVMEKAKTINLYSDIISRLNQAINEALNIPNKNTFDGYARCRFAATLAKDVDACVNVLRFAGGSGSVPAGLKSENEYLVDANNIIKNIPVRVVVVKGSEFDKASRIQNAFAAAIGGVGFRTGDASSPYALQVTLALTEVQLPANPQNYKWARYEISAEMIDVKTRQGLLQTYSINDRSGHANLQEAQNRAIADAEKRINTEYKKLLEESLVNLK